MANFYQKEHQETAAELDSLLRIALTKRTPAVRVAFGRALHKAFTDVISNFSSYSTVGLCWIEGRESTVADVLGNTSAFFESLARTISAPAILSQPELFAMINPEKRLQFVRLAFDVRTPVRKPDLQETLRALNFTASQIQQFMLTLFEQYSEDGTHPIWMELSRYCELQLEWDMLWRHLSADEVRRILLSVAKTHAELLISPKTRRICSLLEHRLAADVVEEIVDLAVSSVSTRGFDALAKVEEIFAAGTLRSKALHERRLTIAWSSLSVHALAAVESQNIDLSARTASELLEGLEYVCHQLLMFRLRQFDCWPLFRMRRWCLEALFALGYVEAPLEKEIDAYGREECVVYYKGKRQVALNQCSKLPVGTLVLFHPSSTGEVTDFSVASEI